jgi:hypothetical protein
MSICLIDTYPFIHAWIHMLTGSAVCNEALQLHGGYGYLHVSIYIYHYYYIASTIYLSMPIYVYLSMPIL